MKQEKTEQTEMVETRAPVHFALRTGLTFGESRRTRVKIGARLCRLCSLCDLMFNRMSRNRICFLGAGSAGKLSTSV
jgi:hypothetical protein